MRHHSGDGGLVRPSSPQRNGPGRVATLPAGIPMAGTPQSLAGPALMQCKQYHSDTEKLMLPLKTSKFFFNLFILNLLLKSQEVAETVRSSPSAPGPDPPKAGLPLDHRKPALALHWSSSPPGSECLQYFGFPLCFLLTHSFPTDMSHNWSLSLATQQLPPPPPIG